MVSRKIPLLVTSDPLQGARNISADGSRFEIELEEPIVIPAEAVNVEIDVEQATVWWVVPNVITGQNDKFYISAPRAVDDVITAFVVTIPQGLYDVAGLNQAVLRELETAGAKIDPSPVVELGSDNATQKVVIALDYTGSSIDFTPGDTFRGLIGFDSQVLGPTVSEPVTFLADEVAQFNQVNYFLLHSDLTGQGIRFNNAYNKTIAQILIDVPPGSQITYAPENPATIAVPNLTGVSTSTIKFWLTDDRNNAINTNGEVFTARLSIRYLIPHIIG